MNTSRNNYKSLWMTVLFILTLTVGAWKIGEAQSKKQKREGQSAAADTTFPGDNGKNKHEIKAAELEKAMKHLDAAMAKLNEEMGKMDFSKMEKQLANALKEVDAQKMEASMQKALSQVNVEDANEQVQKALAKAQAELKKVDMEKLKAQMQQLKASLKENELNQPQFKTQLENAMKQAKAGMLKAKQEIKLMQEFIDALHSDGLIDKHKPYSIELKDGALYINGEKQADSVKNKYHKYLEGKQDNFTIKNDGRSEQEGKGEEIK